MWWLIGLLVLGVLAALFFCALARGVEAAARRSEELDL